MSSLVSSPQITPQFIIFNCQSYSSLLLSQHFKLFVSLYDCNPHDDSHLHCSPGAAVALQGMLKWLNYELCISGAGDIHVWHSTKSKNSIWSFMIFVDVVCCQNIHSPIQIIESWVPKHFYGYSCINQAPRHTGSVNLFAKNGLLSAAQWIPACYASSANTVMRCFFASKYSTINNH